MPKIINELLQQLQAALPNFLKALGLIILGYILARLIATLFKRLLRSIKVDNLAQKLNSIDLIGGSKINLVPSVILSKILYYFILFAFLIAATELLNIQAVSELMTSLLNYIPILLSALLVFIIGLFVADSLKKIVYTTCNSLGIPAAGLIANILFYFVLVNVLMITLSQAKINTEFIQDNLSIILAGIVLAFAIGYGFASKDLMANLLSAFYNKEKLHIGQTIGIGELKGKVVEIGKTTLTLQAEDKRIIIPLSKLTSEALMVFEENEEQKA